MRCRLRGLPLRPEEPVSSRVKDAVEALEWVYSNGKAELGIDRSRIAVGGSSAQVHVQFCAIYMVLTIPYSEVAICCYRLTQISNAQPAIPIHYSF